MKTDLTRKEALEYISQGYRITKGLLDDLVEIHTEYGAFEFHGGVSELVDYATYLYGLAPDSVQKAVKIHATTTFPKMQHLDAIRSLAAVSLFNRTNKHGKFVDLTNPQTRNNIESYTRYEFLCGGALVA